MAPLLHRAAIKGVIFIHQEKHNNTRTYLRVGPVDQLVEVCLSIDVQSIAV